MRSCYRGIICAFKFVVWIDIIECFYFNQLLYYIHGFQVEFEFTV
jgi:hypothetical protein